MRWTWLEGGSPRLPRRKQRSGGQKKKHPNVQKKKVKTSITFFVCLGLKRAELVRRGLPRRKQSGGQKRNTPMCKKKKVKTSIKFLVCLGLKRAERYFGGYKKK